MNRDQWELWKIRNGVVWDWLTTPIILLLIAVIYVYRIYLRGCLLFGLKPCIKPFDL